MNILFMCTANSCRSILSEAVFNHLAPQNLRAVSAGSMPSGTVNAMALATLAEAGVSVTGLFSKGAEAFSENPPDIVITVCDKAAGEPCPLYLGDALKAHWGLADPSEVRGDSAAVQKAFSDTLEKIRERCLALLQLPLEQLSKAELKQALDHIGTL